MQQKGGEAELTYGGDKRGLNCFEKSLKDILNSINGESSVIRPPTSR